MIQVDLGALRSGDRALGVHGTFGKGGSVTGREASEWVARKNNEALLRRGPYSRGVAPCMRKAKRIREMAEESVNPT